MKKLVIVNYGFQTYRPFASLFDMRLDYKDARSVHPGDILILEGGSDIDPELYGEPRGRFTQRGCSKREALEIQAYQSAVRQGAGIIGICRGAQLITALLGGKLIQDVSGHNSDHQIITDAGEVLETTSIHHQMMVPNKIPHELLAWSVGLSQAYLNGNNQDIRNELLEINSEVIEPEIVYYPQVKALAIQGHPEYLVSNHPFNQYVRSLVSNLLMK